MATSRIILVLVVIVNVWNVRVRLVRNVRNVRMGFICTRLLVMGRAKLVGTRIVWIISARNATKNVFSVPGD